MPYLPSDSPPLYTIHDKNNHEAKSASFSLDPKQVASTRTQALQDLQELIGNIIAKLNQQTIPMTIDTMTPSSLTPQTAPPKTTSKSPPEPPSPPVASLSPSATPVELPQLIAKIVNTPVPTASQTAFQFELTPAAAIRNALILEQHHFDLGKAIRAEGNSPLKYGSEFCPKSILAPLLDRHPNWKYIGKLFTDGCSFIAPKLTETDRLCQLELAMSFGNHKGALKKPQQLLQLLQDDVIHGYNLPVSIDLVYKMHSLVLSPMNIARQNTIDETGRVIEKDRLTHDHSYEMFPGLSINRRCRLNLHQTCMFRKALSRMIHWIVEMRN
jgi:hypothetical protein